MSKEIRFKGIVATLAQIAADAFAGRISWASDLARPVHYYTDSDYAVLARKDVAETFPGVKITNQAGPVARMVQAGTDGTQSAVSAATARSTIGAQEALGYTPVNKAGDTMTGGLTLTTLSTTGLATLQSLKISSQTGTEFRPAVIGADGTVSRDNSGTMMQRASGGYVGVRNPSRLAGDPYEFWDSFAGWADIHCGTIKLNSLTASTIPVIDANKKIASQDYATFRGTIGAVATSEKGAANGVAPLGADSKIASTYLPSYVDDVLEFASLASFPATGESGKIYVAIDTAKTYRWSGSAYVVISETLALGETSSTAYRGDRGKTAYDHSQATGNPHGMTFAQIASIPAAIDAIDGLTPAADRIAYYTGANAASLATLSAFGRSLIDDADQAAARTTLGAAAAADVQSFATEYDNQNISFTGNYNSPISPIHTFPANFFSKNKVVRITGRINSGDLSGRSVKYLFDGSSTMPFYTVPDGEQGFICEIWVKCLTAPSGGNVELLVTGRITAGSTRIAASMISASYAVASPHTIGLGIDNAGASGSVGCYMWTVEQLTKGA